MYTPSSCALPTGCASAAGSGNATKTSENDKAPRKGLTVAAEGCYNSRRLNVLKAGPTAFRLWRFLQRPPNPAWVAVCFTKP